MPTNKILIIKTAGTNLFIKTHYHSEENMYRTRHPDPIPFYQMFFFYRTLGILIIFLCFVYGTIF